MVTFLKHAKTSEMALFHVCHFDGFCRLTLEFAEGVHRSMSYGLQKFSRGGKKSHVTYRPWKTASQNGKFLN